MNVSNNVSFRHFHKHYRYVITSGRATLKGTQRYAERHSEVAFFESENAGNLQISKIGYGTYRIRIGEIESEKHIASLIKALSSGVNLVDTSSNFSDGDAETMTGKVIKHLIREKKVARDEIVVVGKAGIVQGKLLNKMIEQDKENPAGNPEIVKLDESFWYNISPQYLEDQITHSLNNLQLDCIDFFLLNNPEYYFMKFTKTGIWDREFYSRIQKAFSHLEKEVQRGRIQYYGVTSNSFHLPVNHHTSVSLEFLLHAAKEACNGSNLNHFKIIQFPFNLFEHGVYSNKNLINNSISTIQLAKDTGILSMGSRPLNAIVDNALFRFALPPKPTDDISNMVRSAKQILNQTMHLEATYPGRDPIHPLTTSGHLPDAMEVSWAHHLVSRPLDYYKFLEIVDKKIIPITDGHLITIKKIEGMKKWAEEYKEYLGKSLIEYRNLLEFIRYQDVTHFQSKLTESFPFLSKIQNLPQMELQLLLASGVDSVVTGMKQEPYVDDSLTVLKSKFKVSEDFVPDQLFQFGTLQANSFLEKHKVATESCFNKVRE
jgi:aryl-alcohol dehydrogenase-like predicted oxidoreductase